MYLNTYHMSMCNITDASLLSWLLYIFYNVARYAIYTV